MIKDRLYKKYNKDLDKNDSKEVLDILGLLPNLYKGDIKLLLNKLNEIKENYPNFTKYVDEYFIKYKLEYFQNGNYNLLPLDCRSNSCIENYNLFMKQNL